ncbi:hypothetical protein ACLOJK_008134 [Asimina triloba]
MHVKDKEEEEEAFKSKQIKKRKERESKMARNNIQLWLLGFALVGLVLLSHECATVAADHDEVDADAEDIYKPHQAQPTPRECPPGAPCETPGR